jgi:peptide deformylase
MKIEDYNLIPHNDPILSIELPKFDFSSPSIDPKELKDILVSKMNEAGGIGLSANQLGLPYRAFVMKADPEIICFNPIVVDQSESQIVMEEGCLSYPGLFVKIRRSGMIKVRYANETNNVITTKLSGISARVFLHELDHLNGINYLSRATSFSLQKAKNKLKLLKRRIK